MGGGGDFVLKLLLLEMGPSNLNINIFILINEIFFDRGVPGGIIISTSLLDIAPLNININIFILINEVQIYKKNIVRALALFPTWSFI